MLVVELVRQQRKAHIPTAVITLGPSQPTFNCEMEALRGLGCEIFEPPRFLSKVFRALWIRRSVVAFGGDVIFAHSLLPSVWARLGMLGMKDRYLVSVLHSIDDYGEMLVRWFERLTWRLTSVVVCVGEEGMANFRKRVTSAAPMALIPSGVDVERFRAASLKRNVTCRVGFDASPKEVILLQVGRIEQTKQQLLTAEMFVRLIPLIGATPVRLVFAGLIQDAEYQVKVENIVREAGLSDRVQFLGPRHDIPELLAAADLYLMPSHREAQGIAALEALASGIFCVFSPLACFHPYSALPGVMILEDVTHAENYALEVCKVIRSGAVSKRYQRSLAQYGIAQCAQAYIEISRQLLMRAQPKSSPG